MLYQSLLAEFWKDFKAALDQTSELTITDVIDHLDQDLEQVFFTRMRMVKLSVSVRNVSTGRLGLKLGKFGAFIGCSNYPECSYTRQINQIMKMVLI